MNSKVYDKAYQFAIRIANVYKHLYKKTKEFVDAEEISKMLWKILKTTNSSLNQG